MKKIICVIFSLVLAVSVGMYSGLKYTEGVLKKNDYIKDQISDAIAVINLDEGVNVNGETLYYSSSLIAELGEGYSLESSSGAQAGLESGKYGAVITFPANTSTCIESVNSANPVQLQIDYSINGNLDSNSYAGMVSKIADFRNKVNNMISYTYVVSIISSLHDAQDTANQLLSNNEDVLTALDELELMDYVDDLELDSIPALNFQPEDLEVTTYLNEANSYANDISNYYLSSYQDAQNDFDAIQTAMTENAGIFDEQLTSYIDQLRSWETRSNENNTAVYNYAEYLRGYNATINDYNSVIAENAETLNLYIRAYQAEYAALTDWNRNLTVYTSGFTNNWATLHDSISEYTEDAADYEISSLISAYTSALDEFNTQSAAYIDYLEHQSQPQPEPGQETEETVPEEMNPGLVEEPELQDGPQVDGDVVDGEINELPQNVSDTVNNLDSDQLDEAQDVDSLEVDTRTPEQRYYEAKADLETAITNLINAFNVLSNDASNISNASNNMSDYLYDANGMLQIPTYEAPVNQAVNINSFSPDSLMVSPAPTLAPDLEQYTLDPLPEWSSEIDQSASELVRLSDAYNPMNYLSTSVNDQIAARYSRFSSYSSGVENQINSAYDINVGRMQTELGRYTSYVNNMRNTAINTYNDEQESFQASVTAYADEIRAINESNNDLIGSFVALMPESRSGSDINTGVVDAIVEPIGFTSSSTPVTAETTSFGNVTSKLVYVMAGSGLCAAVLLVWVAIDSVKKRTI